MAHHLLFADDFSGYANQIAFEDAYPYDPPGDLSSSLSGSPDSPYVRWGLTNGPGGVPGLANETDPLAVNGQFALAIDKAGLDPQCRIFRVVGTYDFQGYEPSHVLNQSSTLFSIWSYETGNRSGSFDGNLVVVGRHHLTGAMVVTVRTTLAFGNAGTSYSQTFSALLPEAGGSFTIQIDGKRSELTESSPGIWAPSTDGYVRVSVNGSDIFSFDGPVWHGEDTTNRTWNSVTYKPVGTFTDLQIWDSDECSTIPTDGTPLCACVTPPTTTPPGTLPPTITHPPPIEAVIGEQFACGGGGLVPIQDDFAPAELWWGR